MGHQPHGEGSDPDAAGALRSAAGRCRLGADGCGDSGPHPGGDREAQRAPADQAPPGRRRCGGRRGSLHHIRSGAIVEAAGQPLPRPRFVAIVSSHVLATHLARSETGRPWGLVIELPVAGGHNAPPRGRLTLSEAGEPIYGPRDVADLEQLRELGIPFWLAGGYASPARLREALEQGASGVQVGTAFALCEESGLEPGLKRRAREAGAAGTLRVHTDPLASPTGYPFKVASLVGTAADPAVQDPRRRRCDLGYMAVAYRRADGELGYRCPAEPKDDFTAKGGDPSQTEGRLCLCNGLVAAVGMPQQRRGAERRAAAANAWRRGPGRAQGNRTGRRSLQRGGRDRVHAGLRADIGTGADVRVRT